VQLCGVLLNYFAVFIAYTVELYMGAVTSSRQCLLVVTNFESLYMIKEKRENFKSLLSLIIEYSYCHPVQE